MPVTDDSDPRRRIKVVAVGGLGRLAVNQAMADGMAGVDFIAVDTDEDELAVSSAPTKVLLSGRCSGSRGDGSETEFGRDSVGESVDRLREALRHAEFVVVVAGMGGRTGTDLAAVVARTARDLGALTVGVVTMPFVFEGARRRHDAERGQHALETATHVAFVLPCAALHVEPHASATAGEVVQLAAVAVQGLIDPLTQHGMLGFAFDDFEAVLPKTGQARLGMASGQGMEGLLEAAEVAVASPLFGDCDIARARGIFIEILGGIGVRLRWVHEIVLTIQRLCHGAADVAYMLNTQPDWTDTARITVYATGMPVDRTESVSPR